MPCLIRAWTSELSSPISAISSLPSGAATWSARDLNFANVGASSDISSSVSLTLALLVGSIAPLSERGTSNRPGDIPTSSPCGEMIAALANKRTRSLGTSRPRRSESTAMIHVAVYASRVRLRGISSGPNFRPHRRSSRAVLSDKLSVPNSDDHKSGRAFDCVANHAASSSTSSSVHVSANAEYSRRYWSRFCLTAASTVSLREKTTAPSGRHASERSFCGSDTKTARIAVSTPGSLGVVYSSSRPSTIATAVRPEARRCSMNSFPAPATPGLNPALQAATSSQIPTHACSL
ncbi:hypothetical protein LMG22037_05468 [Paraburkholderia phenoliruptrix]|uniref:Uncharacterized protein n=1 Tax=Paraburkholderia phenoliruptrix TaxID=252970 RepID=A0A6J5C7J8_9BURK|nr:hypothetical protein LMG22037_05468 [Paraburkholderia phenoliruptrix]